MSRNTETDPAEYVRRRLDGESVRDAAQAAGYASVPPEGVRSVASAAEGLVALDIPFEMVADRLDDEIEELEREIGNLQQTLADKRLTRRAAEILAEL